MKPTQQLHDLGQSLWLDNITRRYLTGGTLRGYIDELSVTGLTSNPTIFDLALKSGTDYDDTIRQGLASGRVGRGAVLRPGGRGPDAGRRPVPARPPGNQRRGRLGVARGVAAAGLRHAEHHRRGETAPRARGTAEPVHQDSGHARGPAGHRGMHLRGRADQRHPALLARPLRRRRRSLHPWARAPTRRWPAARRALGGVDLREPLGQGRDGQGA